jgi:protein involved in polysaccharide export with SLBB domain
VTRVLKRGDKVVIALRDIPTPDEIKDEIDAGGTVNLPLIGIVKLEGKATAEAEDLIEKMYIDGGYYVKISAIVMAEEDEYFVQGEVKREARYPLTRDLTLLQAIATSGGYTDYAKKSQVKIIRGNDVIVVDTNRIEERKDKDPLIKPSDIIVVPRKIFL